MALEDAQRRAHRRRVRLAGQPLAEAILGVAATTFGVVSTASASEKRTITGTAVPGASAATVLPFRSLILVMLGLTTMPSAP